MNLSMCFSVFGVVSSFFMSMFLPPVLFCRACLASQCAGQCNKRCCTVSGLCKHAVQIGESPFLIQWRFLANGAWPVLNCVRVLASHLGKLAISLMYAFDGVVGSMSFILLNHSDFSHVHCAFCWSFPLYAHLIADLLYRRGSLSCAGRIVAFLLPSVMDFLLVCLLILCPQPLCVLVSI